MGFVLLQFRLEFCNTNDCNIRYMITESLKTAWKVLQIRNLCFTWASLLIKTLNESIQCNYYFFSYCIFISNFQFSQFSLKQTLRCFYVDGERNLGKFLGRNNSRFEFKSNFKCFAKSNDIVFYMSGELFSKLRRFFPVVGPIFYIFCRFVKTKCRTFLRMALNRKT